MLDPSLREASETLLQLAIVPVREPMLHVSISSKVQRRLFFAVPTAPDLLEDHLREQISAGYLKYACFTHKLGGVLCYLEFVHAKPQRPAWVKRKLGVQTDIYWHAAEESSRSFYRNACIRFDGAFHEYGVEDGLERDWFRETTTQLEGAHSRFLCILQGCDIEATMQALRDSEGLVYCLRGNKKRYMLYIELVAGPRQRASWVFRRFVTQGHIEWCVFNWNRPTREECIAHIHKSFPFAKV